jgi:hypothetical protein
VKPSTGSGTRNVFTKLDINFRRELRRALPAIGQAAVAT